MRNSKQMIQHYVRCQAAYMALEREQKKQIDALLFVAVCPDTDEEERDKALDEIGTILFQEAYSSSVFAKRLRAVLKRKGISQSELARKMGFTPALVGRWCSGANVTVGTARRAAAALEVPLMELLGDD